jgi:hypothetical protein
MPISTASEHHKFLPKLPILQMFHIEMSNNELQPGLISNLMHKIIIYLHIIRLLKPSTCFEHYPAHLQEVYVVIIYIKPLVSSHSAGDCLVHRLRKKFFVNRCTGQSPAESDDTRSCIYTNYDVDLLKMSRVLLETCRGF